MAVTIKINPCPDSTVTVNDSAYGSAPSNTTFNVDVEYKDGTDVGTISGSIVEIPNNRFAVGNRIQTGQTVSYATNDDGFFQNGLDNLTLPFLNPFGNNNRWTKTDGNPSDQNSPLLDWLTWDGTNDPTSEVWAFAWSRRLTTGTSTKTWSQWMTQAPFTDTDGFTGYYLSNVEGLWRCFNYAQFALIDGFPFNVVTSAGGNLWTSTSRNRPKHFLRGEMTKEFCMRTKLLPHLDG